jgi:molybdopterin-binding protein
MEQSIRNELPGTVKEIISDKVLSEIIVETRIGEMAAVITTRSVQDMGLKAFKGIALFLLPVVRRLSCFIASGNCSNCSGHASRNTFGRDPDL